MESSIRIVSDYQAKVSELLQTKLKMTAQAADRMVSCGDVAKGDFFHNRQEIGAIYTTAIAANPYVAKLFDDAFFQANGLKEDFYVDLYDDTFDDAAGEAGDDDAAIDSSEDLKKLEELLSQKAGSIRWKLDKVLDNYVQTFIRDDQIKVVQNGDVVEAEVGGTHPIQGPFPMGALKELFFDDVERMGKIAKALFDSQKVVKIVSPTEKIVKTEIHCTFPVPNQFAYVRIKLHQEAGGSLKVEMTQLTPEEENQLGFTPIVDHRMGYLRGDFIMTQMPGGEGVGIKLKVKGNPDLTGVPNAAIAYIMKDQILEASRALTKDLFKSTYFSK